MPYRYALPVLNLIGFIGTIVVNTLAVVLPLNGMTTGQLSDKYDTLFTPIGLTFSIWGLIYLLLGLFVGYQWVRTRRDAVAPPFTAATGIWFFITCLANMGWLFAWHFECIPLSLLVMVVLLCSLIIIYMRLGIGVVPVFGKERYFVHVPFSVYLGWVSIATIANVAALLVSIHWDAFGVAPQYWTVGTIGFGVSLALASLALRRDVYFALAVDWALLGIALKRYSVAAVAEQSILIAAIVGLVAISAVIAIQIVQKRVYCQEPELQSASGNPRAS